MANRFLDWMKQAEADFRHAEKSLSGGDFEWCCFASQQAAEKAVKALFLLKSIDAWGHTLSALLGSLPVPLRPENDLLDCAKVLDKHYLPTRYPNGFDSGAPTDFYTRQEGEQAIECARKIITYCRSQIQRS